MTRDMTAHHRMRDRLIEAQAAQIAAERRAQADRKLAAFKPRPRQSAGSTAWLWLALSAALAGAALTLIVLEVTT